MNRLPDELCLQVVEYLDVDPPSVVNFTKEPKFGLTISDCSPLKTLSTLTRQWRRIAFPALFRFCSLHLGDETEWVVLDGLLLHHLESHKEHLNEREQRIASTLRECLHGQRQKTDDIVQILDDDEVLKTASRQWLPRFPDAQDAFLRFVIENELHRVVESLTIYTLLESEPNPQIGWPNLASRFSRHFWVKLFTAIDPARLVIAAPPATLATLSGSSVETTDGWLFDMKIHYLELTRPENYKAIEHNETCLRYQHPGASIIYMRPWTHLAYNEGSSVPVYGTYEHFSKRSPMVLVNLLQKCSARLRSCCNLSTVSFTAIFPIANNFSTLLHCLRNSMTLTSVTLKLAPEDETGILDSQEKLKRAQYDDLWMEYETSYDYAIRFLGAETNVTKFTYCDGSQSIRGGKLASKFRTRLTLNGWEWKSDNPETYVRPLPEFEDD